MPNWCSNSFTATNLTEGDVELMAKAIEEEKFFGTLVPEPDYSITPVAKTFPHLAAITATTEEEKQKEIEKANKPSIREDSWYDWRLQNWGTKWDISDIDGLEIDKKEGEVSFSFQSPWSPPEEGVKNLSSRFLGAFFTITFEESGSDFFGACVAHNGELFEKTSSFSEVQSEWLSKNHPEVEDIYEEPEVEGDFCDFLHELQEEMLEGLMEMAKAGEFIKG